MNKYPKPWEYLEFFDTCSFDKSNTIIGIINYADQTRLEYNFSLDTQEVIIKLFYNDHNLVNIKYKNIIKISFDKNSSIALFTALDPEPISIELKVKPTFILSIII